MEIRTLQEIADFFQVAIGIDRDGTVNIFGGIMRCDVVAQGIVEAAREAALDIPLVVRLEGTNVEKGKQIIKESGLNIIPADDLGDAAKKAVASVKA